MREDAADRKDMKISNKECLDCPKTRPAPVAESGLVFYVQRLSRAAKGQSGLSHLSAPTKGNRRVATFSS